LRRTIEVYVGTDDSVRPQSKPILRNFMRIRSIFRADRVVGPYYAFKDSVENFELSQASWEKTGKTEGKFWSVQGGPEEIELPPGRKFLI